MKHPIDLTKVSAQDVLPEGKFRARIVSAEIRPKDKEIGSNGELVGVFGDDGKQKYAVFNVGFKFTEHGSNYAVDPKSGETVNLAGRQIWWPISYHPSFRQHIREVYDATGTDAGEDAEALFGKEVDVTLKNKPRRDDPEVKETVVQRVRVAIG